MSDTSTHTTETTKERKPPTLADIVREKTDDGKRIIDFFLDVMEDRIDGAELCHRIDAAKQLEKHKSKADARFLAEYRGVSCGHSINGRPDPADPCSAEERSLVAVTLNAPATLTKDFLTVLSGIDEFLMARLIRAQTADGGTIIDFLDDVMQDRNDGFKTHHRIAAAKELIVHIVRDEQPVAGYVHPELVEGPEAVEARSAYVPAEPRQIVVPAEAGTQGGGGGRNTVANSVRAEPVLSTAEGSAHPEPNSFVVPAEAEPAPYSIRGTQRSGEGLRSHSSLVHLEPVEGPVGGPEPAEGSQLETLPARRPRTRRTRTQRRRDGAARAATLGKGSERNDEEAQDKPAPVELTPAERRIKERLEQHWHEPDPYGAPIDSTHPGRSPPR